MPSMSHAAENSEFCKLCAGQSQVNLVRLLLEFAADAYPHLCFSTCEQQVARLGEAARLAASEELAWHQAQRRSASREECRQRLSAVSRLLYEQEGFHGNEQDYYDPRNSYLNEVLRRRTGIPITLAIVYLAVAERAGLPCYGVGAPGHFLVGCSSARGALYVDPFIKGEILCGGECRRRVEAISGRGACSPESLAPASHRDIAARVLRNLKLAYAKRERWNEALPVQKRLVCLLPEALEERRDLGLILLRTGEPWSALTHLREYVEERPAARCEMEPFLRTARRMTSELN